MEKFSQFRDKGKPHLTSPLHLILRPTTSSNKRHQLTSPSFEPFRIRRVSLHAHNNPVLRSLLHPPHIRLLPPPANIFGIHHLLPTHSAPITTPALPAQITSLGDTSNTGHMVGRPPSRRRQARFSISATAPTNSPPGFYHRGELYLSYRCFIPRCDIRSHLYD